MNNYSKVTILARILVLNFLLLSFGAISPDVVLDAFAKSKKERKVYTIVIKDHLFEPKELIVPTNEKIKLIIENHDITVEEFESYDLNREKIVKGNSKITVFIGPLEAGEYKYFGEFHENTAQGVIIAKSEIE